jgi:hypothetical protein
MPIQVGDMIRVPGAMGTYHVGIYVGRTGGRPRAVVHNAKGLGVVICDLGEFAAGRAVELESRVPGGWWAQQRAARRALSLVGLKYDLLNFNCEHAATLAQTGEARSSQLRAAGTGLLVILGIAALARAGEARR